VSPLVLALLAASPDVAVLSTRPGDGYSELRFQRVGATELSPAVARFVHLDDATALGALLPSSRKVLATATVLPGDASFASALVLLEPGQPTRVLADQVALGNRPFVTASGRIFVQRGVAGVNAAPSLPGPKPRDAQLRVDSLRIDEIRLDAEPRTVFSVQGYTAFIAGAAGCSAAAPSPGLRPPSPGGEGTCEVIVYRVAPGEASLLAVNVDTLAQRTLARLEPLARDFVVDEAAHRFVFTLGESATRRWHLVSVDLHTGELSTLATGRLPSLLPFVLQGRVGFSPGANGGLQFTSGERCLDAQGPGFDHLRFVTRDGTRVGLDEIPSGFPRAFAVDAHGKSLGLLVPPDARLDLAGAAP